MRVAKLSFREKPAGGGYLDDPEGTDAAMVRRPQFVFLVHGYNAPRKGAEDGYDSFRRELRKLNSWVATHLVYVLWPADWAVKAISIASYPFQKRVAAEVAPIFARYLAARRGPLNSPCEIVLIGHSLGCRLVLETLVNLAAQHHVDRSRISVILLAAAVPVDALEEQQPMRAALTGLRHVVTLYSTADKILARIFPFTDDLRISKIARSRPEAIGLNGAPDPGPWTPRPGRVPMGQLGHTEYWSSSQVANEVSSILGPRVWRPPERYRQMVTRATPTTSEIEARTDIPFRRPPGA